MKTSRFGSSLGCLLRKARRSAATSGRSCSAACRLFFKGQLQMTQEAKDRCLTDLDPPLRQHGLEFCQRDVRLLCQLAPDQILICCQGIGFVSAELRRTDAPPFALEPEKPRPSSGSPHVAPQLPPASHLPRSPRSPWRADRSNTASPFMLASSPVRSLNHIRPLMGIPDSTFSENALVVTIRTEDGLQA